MRSLATCFSWTVCVRVCVCVCCAYYPVPQVCGTHVGEYMLSMCSPTHGARARTHTHTHAHTQVHLGDLADALMTEDEDTALDTSPHRDGVSGFFCCLICLSYMSAVYACLACHPYMSALYACLTCQSCMPAFHVNLTCLPYSSA